MTALLATLLACGSTTSTVDPTDTPTRTTPTGDTGAPEETGGTTPDGTDTLTTTIEVDPVPLELCINEFMPHNTASVLDDYGGHADWIELHNPNAFSVPLDGWSLTDDPLDPRKHVMTGGLVLEPGGFLLLWADGYVVNPVHLGFSLAEEGEAVALFAPDGTGSVVRYPEVGTDLAVARGADCCLEEGCISYVFRGTPGASNQP